ncbi:MAG: hypothetical protein A2868_03990 [Candidatus Levybacteria bacterium RIFCSPHIGHO2_01_FULL_40_15b]|nr:MAG: hypothetical protein A2868_03990 [Candidatus Levybacteria bacterium RIFCSPHIGHO2_01_FULL_40_15b]
MSLLKEALGRAAGAIGDPLLMLSPTDRLVRKIVRGSGSLKEQNRIDATLQERWRREGERPPGEPLDTERTLARLNQDNGKLTLPTESPIGLKSGEAK